MTTSNINTNKHISWQNITICLLASLAGILFGMDTGIISGALPFIAHEFSANNQGQQIIVSSVLFGAAVGTITSAFLAKPLGRRRTILLAAFIFMVASFFSAIAHSIAHLVMARAALGIAVGMAAYNAPLYLAEVASSEIRGSLVTLYQAMVNLGIVIALVIDLVLTYTGNWRLMLFSLAFPAILLFIGTLLMPPSPRWLILKKQKKAAREVLHKIRQGSEEDILNEIYDIEQVEKLDHEGWSLFKRNGNFRRVVFLGIALQAAQQLTGINVMFYYAPKVFTLVGFVSPISKMWGGVLLGVIDFSFTLLAILFVDRVGRKPLLYWGALGMGAAFLVLAYLFSTPMDTVTLRTIAVLMLVLFMIAFAMSSGPVTWILCSEINPLKGRSLGMMTSTTTNWLVNLVIGATFLTLLSTLGGVKTFILYGVINLALIIIYYFYTPETRKISLEQLEQNLMKGKRLRDIGQVSN
ncbi:MAG: sugar porter family MFS transporter [Pseudomonadota bacterium]